MSNRIKTLRKSVYWSGHGKHRGLLIICIGRNKEAALKSRRHQTPMFETVPDMMEHYKAGRQR